MMNPHKINRGKRKRTFWQIKDYIRQLSIVILGIVVTFAANDAITNYSQSKEIQSALQLVRTELEMNLEKVRKINSRIAMEQKACSYLLKYAQDFQQASEDTLFLYQNIPFQSRTFSYTKDAIDLLKSSSLFQKIRPKDLTLQIITTYSDLEMVAGNVKDFYNMKMHYADMLMMNEKFDVYNMDRSSSIAHFWKNFLSFREGWNLCNFVVHNFASDSPFGDIELSLENTIRLLDQKSE